MHTNNALVLWWERRKRREQDKEAKVSQARQRCRFLLSQTPRTPRCSLLALPSVAKQRGGCLSEKVTKINKRQTPPPTTWPKARGCDARCCSSFSLPGFSRFLRCAREEQSAGGPRRSQRSPWAGCAAQVLGQEGTEAAEQLATITTSARFKVWRAAIVKPAFVAAFSGERSPRRYFQQFLQFPKFTWQPHRVGGTA